MIFLSALLSCLFISCSKEDYEITDDADITHTIPMYFEGDISSADGMTTRATKTLADGTSLYIDLMNGNDTIKGTAVYHSSNNGWTFTYAGTLPNSTSTSKLYYIENPKSIGQTTISLDKSTAIYYTGSGTYTYNAKGLTVTATLTPLFPCFKFKGTAGTTIKFTNVYFPNAFDISSRGITYLNKVDTIETTVLSNGFTPAFYYTAVKDSIIVLNGYSRFSIANILPTTHGKCGYITIPTDDNYTGWTRQEIGGSHEAVNLGLSVKWATMNVGATSPEGYGLYFAWGDTVGYTSDTNDGHTFRWSTCVYANSQGSSFTKYSLSDGKTTLELMDDAAYSHWKGSWRMPTDAEFTELRTKCTWSWTTLNGVKGYKVTGNNGNYIFLPAAGFRAYITLYYPGVSGRLWSSSRVNNNSTSAYYLDLGSGSLYRDDDYRYNAHSVRAVCP